MAKKGKLKGRSKSKASNVGSHDIRVPGGNSSPSVLASARRQAMVGEGADAVLSTCPVDVMAARGIISNDHAHACKWFLRLYRYRNGSGTIKGTLDDGAVDIPSSGERERRDIEWFALLDSRGFSADDMATVVNVVVFGGYPRWLGDVIESGSSLRYDGKTGWDVGFAGDAQMRAALDRTAAERRRDVAVLDRLRDVWLAIGRVSDDRLRQMSRQGRAQLERASGGAAAAVGGYLDDCSHGRTAVRAARQPIPESRQAVRREKQGSEHASGRRYRPA